MCETEILSQLLEEVIASVQRFFFFLPADQSAETLQKRKHLIMLSEMTQLQNHGDDRSSHLVYAGGGHVSEEQGLSVFFLVGTSMGTTGTVKFMAWLVYHTVGGIF